MVNLITPSYWDKVEKILKASLVLTLLHLQWKFKLRQNIAGCCQQTFENKKFFDITQQWFALLPQVNFPTNNLNFYRRWRWWDWIQAMFLNIFYFKFKNWQKPYQVLFLSILTAIIIATIVGLCLHFLNFAGHNEFGDLNGWQDLIKWANLQRASAVQ
jgi:hypothetical protein